MGRGERRQHLCIAISGSIDSGHVMLAPAVVIMLQTAARRHVRVQAAHANSRPLPRLILLLPLVYQQDSSSKAQQGFSSDISSPGNSDNGLIKTAAALASSPHHATAHTASALQQHHGTIGSSWLKSLTQPQVTQLLAAWLAAQARAAGSAEHSPVLVQVCHLVRQLCDNL